MTSLLFPAAGHAGSSTVLVVGTSTSSQFTFYFHCSFDPVRAGITQALTQLSTPRLSKHYLWQLRCSPQASTCQEVFAFSLAVLPICCSWPSAQGSHGQLCRTLPRQVRWQPDGGVGAVQDRLQLMRINCCISLQLGRGRRTLVCEPSQLEWCSSCSVRC